MSTDRHNARILAMQALCNTDAQGGKPTAPLPSLAQEAASTPTALQYARILCEYFATNRNDVDAHIQAVLQDRRLERLEDVSRNVIRVATIEMLTGHVPPKVALDQAIEIAREFADQEAAAFVNGVLDPVLKRTRQEA